ncbi:MAG: hypothetical protein KBS76_00215, partial [Ruminococcus sp.]|nr:hypothetical protein [Candidatus Apopatosoma intestinale]
AGDINGDGEVDAKDITRLFQYIANWNVSVIQGALDVNGDGKVNSKDITRLFQYLANWDVEIYVSGGTAAHTHTFSDWTSRDATTHSRVCSCGETQIAEHVWNREVIKEAALKTAATPTSPAVYYKSCVCGAISTNNADTFTLHTGSDSLDGREKHPDYMDVDFGGATFTFATQKIDDWDCYEITGDASGNDDILNQAIALRNQVLQSKYNCVINNISGQNTYELVSNDIALGRHTVDFELYQYRNSLTNNYLNIAGLDIDLTHDWWDQKFIDCFGIEMNGVKYLPTISGQFNLISYDAIFSMFMNRTLYEQLREAGTITEDVFELVNNGKWTVDAQIKMMREAAQDVNGDARIDYCDGDVVGMTTYANNYAERGFFFGVGGRGSVRDAATGLPQAVNSDNFDFFDQMQSAIDKAIELTGSGYYQPVPGQLLYESFTSGRALFITDALASAASVSDPNANIAILPYPEYNEAQDSYYHYVCNRAYGLKVSGSVTDRQSVADFLEVFGFHSKQLVYPAYLTKYRTQVLSGEEAPAMLDLVIGTKVYDLDYWAGGGQSIVNLCSTFIVNKRNSFSHAVTASANAVNAAFSDYANNMKNLLRGNPNPSGPIETTHATETTVPACTTLGVYARFDYGTESKAQDLGMTSHEYLVEHLTYKEEFVKVTYDEDNIIIRALADYDYATMGPQLDPEKAAQNISGPSAQFANYGLFYEDIMNDYTFEEGQQDLLWGWGSWSNYPYSSSSVGRTWVGRHQYMQARFINGSANTKWSVRFKSTGCGYANTTIGVFDNVDQGRAESTYSTYQVKTWDMAYCFGNSTGTPEATPENGVIPTGNWGWHSNEPVIGLRFHVLGSYCSAYCRGNRWATGSVDYDNGDLVVKDGTDYGNAVDTDFDGIPDTNATTGEKVSVGDKWFKGDIQGAYDEYSLVMQSRYDTRGLIKAGNFVIIDYIIFGSSIEQLNAWTSYAEDAAQ